MPSPLEGVRVIDASTGVAGPMCAMFLADFGADVVKLEAPDGDPARELPGFAVWNRNKRSVVVADDAAGRAAADEWLAAADVLVTGGSDQSVGPGGLALEHAHERNRGLVRVDLPASMGRQSWAGGAESSELLSAFSGLSLRQYSFDGGPVDPVYPHLLYEQAIWAAAVAVAALVERERSGVGQRVTVSGLHAALVASPGSFILDPAAPTDDAPSGPGGRNPMYSRYRCADGLWMFLAALTDRFQERAVELLGIPEIAHDPRLGGSLARSLEPDNRGWVRDAIAAAVAKRPRHEWVAILETGGCPVGELESRDRWLDHPQIEAIGMRVECADPATGDVVMPGQPLVLTKTPATVRSPAPALGSEDASASWPRRARDLAASARGGGPLEGVRVVDLGTILAGPFAGSLLADLGADVVKVEPPGGDPFRRYGFIYNRGMRSLSVDLRDERGRAALRKVIAGADVVIDNYRQGILEQFALRYEDLRAVKDDIITFSITGFGDDGPLAGKLGFDPILQSMSGMMTAQGGDDEPVYLHVAVNDVATAPLTVLGVCLALFHRSRTGEGQRCWTSLAGMSAIMQSGELVRVAGRPPAIVGGRDFKGPSASDRYYKAADAWVRVQAGGTSEQRLWRALGLEGDVPQDDGLQADRIGASIARLRSDECLAVLRAAAVPAVKARGPEDLAADRSLLDAQLLSALERPDGPPCLLPDRFARFDRTERTDRLVAPGLGEHSRELLAEAGLDAEAVDALIRDGLVVQGGPLVYSGPGGYK